MTSIAYPGTRHNGFAREHLVNRDWELMALEQSLHAAGNGGGGRILFFEAPAGGGKTELLRAAGEIAREAGIRVLAAAGSELERDYPLGLARQLFEPLWHQASAGRLEELLRGPAQLAAEVLSDEPPRGGPRDPGEHDHAVIRGLFWATHNLACLPADDHQARGLALVIDDLQWADGLSLRFLAHLAERSAELPIAIVLAVRPGEPSAEPRALAALRRAAGPGLLPLAALADDGVAQIVGMRFPQAEAQFCASCARLSGGNPFLLNELLTALVVDEQAPTEAAVHRLAQVVPDSVRDAVAARLESMRPDTRAVAEAVALLGEGASVGGVARLVELDDKVVVRALDELAAMLMLRPGMPLAFAEPLVETAIRASLPPFQRAHAHRHAARILAEQHADPERSAVGGRALGELTWGDGPLLQPGGSSPLGVPVMTAELVIGDELERAIAIVDAATRSGGGQVPSSAGEPSACVSAWARYEQGRLTEAEEQANIVLGGLADDADGWAQSARVLLARCHIERGRLEPAESLVAGLERQGSSEPAIHALVLDLTAQLRLAQHRPQDALEAATRAGVVLEEAFLSASPGWVPWRSRAALAHLALGEPERARELVEQELEQAQSAGITRIVIRDLRILGLALDGKEEGLEKLAEAIQIGASSPRRLEYLRALVDYGAALRRANRRVEAREPLRLALDISHRCGAGALESRARAELITAGARPRRPAASGIESLTPSQRRVAELAARGLTTRQIAGALFVTPKTVEFHLRQIYLKLEVGSREELAARFRSPDPQT